MPEPITFEQVSALPSRPPDHTIAYGSAPQQFGHLRLPHGKGPHPVVVFIHGGCYRAEYSIAYAGPLEQALADLGYAVWSVEYRRVGDPGGAWPGTFQDVAAAADHLRSLAKQFPLDLKRVIATGHSAGGNLALWLAARNGIATSSPLYVDAPLEISGVVAMAPAGDLIAMHEKNGCGGMAEPLMGGSPIAVPDRYAAACASQLPPSGVPQTLLIGASDERFAAFGRSFAQQLAANNARTQAIEIANAGHFDVIAPTTHAWPIVTKAIEELCAEIR